MIKTFKEKFVLVAFSTAIICLFTFTTFAQSGVDVMKAELASDFSKIEGKVILTNHELVFVDDSRVENSFAIEKDNFADITGEDSILTIVTSRPVLVGTSEKTRFVFRLHDRNAGDFSQNLRFKSSSVNTVKASADVTPSNTATAGVYEVKHGHRLYGSCSGRLIVGADRISYESSDERDHSRQWLLTDIKKLSRKGPYEISIKPFKGSGFTLEVLGSGIDIVDFKALEDKVALAKTRR